MWTAWNTICIDGVIIVFQMRPRIKRNISFGKMKPITTVIRAKSISSKQLFIKIGCVKGRISQKSFGVDKRMLFKEILQGRYQQPCIMYGFILIRRIRFFIYNNLWMLLEKILIIEGNVTYNS